MQLVSRTTTDSNAPRLSKPKMFQTLSSIVRSATKHSNLSSFVKHTSRLSTKFTRKVRIGSHPMDYVVDAFDCFTHPIDLADISTTLTMAKQNVFPLLQLIIPNFINKSVPLNVRRNRESSMEAHDMNLTMPHGRGLQLFAFLGQCLIPSLSRCLRTLILAEEFTMMLPPHRLIPNAFLPN